MRRFLVCLLFLALLMPFSFADAFQDADPENELLTEEPYKDPEWVNASGMPAVSGGVVDLVRANRENLFPISIVRDYFTDAVDAILTEAGPESVMRINSEYGQQDVDLFVNTDLLHDHIGRINVDVEYPDDFEISADITVRDVYPKKEGGCFVGFSDSGMTKAPETAEYLFVFDGSGGVIYVREAGNEAGTPYPVNALPDEPIKFTLSHLTGHTFVFVNDVCVGQFHDGKKGPFRMSYGAVTYADGESACCSFDNLEIRKVCNPDEK